MNLRWTWRLTAAATVCTAACSALATERHVPSEYGTIQAAIDACVAGDTVIMADGTYVGSGNKDLDFSHGLPTGQTRAITVQSASGDPNACVIDCGGNGRGFYFHSGESAISILHGLTIRNGNVTDNGAGVYCSASSPTLINCTIMGNRAVGASSRGGGVYCCSSSNPTLTNCAITGNGAENGGGAYCESSSNPTLTDCTVGDNTAYYGGGVYCRSAASLTFTGCTIAGNAAEVVGGGVYCSSSSPTLTNCTITDNTADYGGGVYCADSSAALANCTITGNTASIVGGGTYCEDSSPTLANCTITGNTAAGTNSHGGGVYCEYSSPRLANCVIRNNTASYGGGVSCGSFSSPTLTNCTITGNSVTGSTGSGGGALNCEYSTPTLTNCILWANTPQQILVESGSPAVTYCDVQGGWSGTGNINAEPRFAFPTDFHLLPDSPCIDTGTNSPPGGLPSQDLDGEPRPLDGDGNGSAAADMGAYEFSPATPRLAVSAAELLITARLGQTGSQTLEIRNSSSGTLAWALQSEAAWLTAEPATGESAGEVDAVTLTADTVDLALGTYTTTLWVNAPQALDAPRAVAVVLEVRSTLHVPAQYATIQAAIDATTLPGDEVVVADGVYIGANNKDLDFRGRAITVRSASGDPNTCIIDCEGSGRGFYFHSGESAASIVQGLTIRNGNVTGSGGGVYCSSSSPTLMDCTITGNAAPVGGGVSCYSSSPTLTNCTITGNTVSNGDTSTYGGGVYCAFASPTLTNCTITGNTATTMGGGMYCCSSSPRLTNCTITANTAEYAGGGMDCVVSSNLTLTNCMIRDNTATYGGGVYCDSSSPRLTNCTITGNSATGSSESGGGAYCEDHSSATLTNCILWANTPQQISVSSASPVVNYCDIQGGWIGTGNINAEPRFAFPTDFHLLPDSPCIDTGTNSPPGGLSLDDLDGQPRPLDGDGNGTAAADMGAYEFNPATPRLAVSATELLITARLGQTGSQTLEIRNSSLGTLAWALQSEATWLTAEPVAGESAGELDTVTLTADTAGLTHGTYVTTLWVNAPQALGAPRAVAVVLHVTSSLHVPDEYATIQGAIDAATLPGDEVIIADGVYKGAGNKDLDFHGRAITVRSASGAPDACIIDCRGSGKGFYFHSGESAASIVHGLTIRNGHVTGSGGGVYCSGASPTLTNCVIKDSSAGSDGGGVYCDSSSSPTLTNCVIKDNNAGSGGGVYCSGSNPTLTNCVIKDNNAGSGGGVSCNSSSSPTLTNCILWANTPQQISVSSASPVVTYCDVQCGWSGTGNIDAEPRFAFSTDLHLLPDSPCIDTGTNSPPGGLAPDDSDGQPRLLDGDANGTAVADMGAYEFNPTTPSLAVSATELLFTARVGQTSSQTLEIRNSSLGTLAWTLQSEATWLSAQPAAGESAGEVDTVTLTADAAHGTYVTTLWVNAPQALNAPRAVNVVLYVRSILHVPGQYATIQAAIDATTVSGDEVVIADGVYTGTGNKDLDFRGRAIMVRSASGDPNTCIIDCGGSGRGFYFYRGESAASIVQDLTIRNANGGGVLCSSSSPTLSNCTITGNGSTSNGGGVYCFGSSPTLTNCTITSNSSTGNGGGVYCNVSRPTLTNCTITGNSATGSGGGVYCNRASSPTLTDCTITGNTAGSGGGVCCYFFSTPTLTNCILWADTPVEIFVQSGSPLVTYCDIQGGWSGTGNINADPLFRNPNGPDNDPNTFADNDYRLLPGSPCIDAGKNSAVPADTPDLDADGNTAEPLPFDLSGQPRFLDDPNTPDTGSGTAPIVDLGAYEFAPRVYQTGNMNCDGAVNFADINPFVLALTGQAAYEAAFPNCRWLNADCNADGTVSFADINPFVALLSGAER